MTMRKRRQRRGQGLVHRHMGGRMNPAGVMALARALKGEAWMDDAACANSQNPDRFFLEHPKDGRINTPEAQRHLP